MKTVSYADILYQAAEATGRTRDKLPAQEATMLQGFIATTLREIWNGLYQWPELIPAIRTVTTTAGLFSKNEGSTNPSTPELGDILGVWTANPLSTPNYVALRFDEQPGQVQLEDGGGTVYVEYMLPCPDLMSATQWTATATYAAGALVLYGGSLASPATSTALNFYTVATGGTIAGDSPDTAPAKFTVVSIPARFRNFLAWTAAGHLARADGQMAQGDELLALGQGEINLELCRLVDVPRRAVRMKNTYAAKQQRELAPGG